MSQGITKPVHSLEDMVARLAQARHDRGLTQTELGARVHVPQGHISRIERGQVDLRASNLIELARSLELEVMLVPRQYLPAVRHLLAERDDDSRDARDVPLYQLHDA